MTTSPYVFAAQPHTQLLLVNLPDEGLDEDTSVFDFLEDMVERHAVVGWEVCGTWAVPLGVYSIQSLYGVAVALPTGEVADFDGDKTHRTIDDWAYAIMDRIRRGGTNRRALMRGQVDATVAAPDQGAKAPEDSPGIDSFGWSGRAVAPLQRMGIKVLSDLSGYARKEIQDTKGVSAEAMWLIESAMIRNDLPWKTGMAVWKPGKHIGPEPETSAVAAGRLAIPTAAVADTDDLNDLI